MSADNYYLIRKDRQGFYVPVMGFASDDTAPIVRGNQPRFRDLAAAVTYASEDYTEYGVSIHPECKNPEPPVLERTANGHYSNCWAPELGDEYGTSPCVCARIQADWEQDYSQVVQ